MSNAESIINLITEAGLDYHDFKIEAIVNNLNCYEGLGYEPTHTFVWENIAEMARRDRALDAAWEIAGTPNPYHSEEWLGAA